MNDKVKDFLYEQGVVIEPLEIKHEGVKVEESARPVTKRDKINSLIENAFNKVTGKK